MKCQTLRSVSDNHVFVLCRDECLGDLPDHIRHQGPWQSLRRGAVVCLKPEYQRDLARDGYVLVRTELAHGRNLTKGSDEKAILLKSISFRGTTRSQLLGHYPDWLLNALQDSGVVIPGLVHAAGLRAAARPARRSSVPVGSEEIFG